MDCGILRAKGDDLVKKTSVIKGILFWGTALLVLATVNLLIFRKEDVLASSRPV